MTTSTGDDPAQDQAMEYPEAQTREVPAYQAYQAMMIDKPNGTCNS